MYVSSFSLGETIVSTAYVKHFHSETKLYTFSEEADIKLLKTSLFVSGTEASEIEYKLYMKDMPEDKIPRTEEWHL